MDKGKGKVLALEMLASIIGLPIGNIPSTIYDFWHNNKSVSLENKVNSYLTAIDTMSPNQRDKFREKVNQNQNFKSDVAYVLIDLIDKTFAERNIDVLANLSHALALGLIDSNDFFRAGGAMKNILYTDLLDLNNYSKKEDVGGFRSNSSFYLQSVGLIRMSTFGGDDILFQLTELGEIVLNYGLNDNFINN